MALKNQDKGVALFGVRSEPPPRKVSKSKMIVMEIY